MKELITGLTSPEWFYMYTVPMIIGIILSLSYGIVKAIKALRSEMTLKKKTEEALFFGLFVPFAGTVIAIMPVFNILALIAILTNAVIQIISQKWEKWWNGARGKSVPNQHFWLYDLTGISG